MKTNSKYIIIVISIFFIFLLGCKLEGDQYIKTDIFPNITGWEMPDTAKLNTDFEIKVESAIDNTCIKNLKFYIDKRDDFKYLVYAKSLYENHGEECYQINQTVDSTLVTSLKIAGKYYFYFNHESLVLKDSIVIIP